MDPQSRDQVTIALYRLQSGEIGILEALRVVEAQTRAKRWIPLVDWGKHFSYPKGSTIGVWRAQGKAIRFTKRVGGRVFVCPELMDMELKAK